MKNGIGCSLPDDLHPEFLERTDGVSKGKSKLITEALREYFINHPFEKKEKQQKV